MPENCFQPCLRAERLAVRSRTTPVTNPRSALIITGLGIGLRRWVLGQAVHIRLEVTQAEPCETLDVDLCQLARGDQALDRSNRDAEALGSFALGDQESIRHAGILRGPALASWGRQVLADSDEVHQENCQLLDLTRHREAFLMELTHMSGQRLHQVPDDLRNARCAVGAAPPVNLPVNLPVDRRRTATLLSVARHGPAPLADELIVHGRLTTRARTGDRLDAGDNTTSSDANMDGSYIGDERQTG